jgi:hypothetical protein
MRIRDPGWRQFGSGIRDPGWKKVGSGIRDKHPGSATLDSGRFCIRSILMRIVYLCRIRQYRMNSSRILTLTLVVKNFSSILSVNSVADSFIQCPWPKPAPVCMSPGMLPQWNFWTTADIFLLRFDSKCSLCHKHFSTPIDLQRHKETCEGKYKKETKMLSEFILLDE